MLIMGFEFFVVFVVLELFEFVFVCEEEFGLEFDLLFLLELYFKNEVIDMNVINVRIISEF